jgi:putative membrane protein
MRSQIRTILLSAVSVVLAGSVVSSPIFADDGNASGNSRAQPGSQPGSQPDGQTPRTPANPDRANRSDMQSGDTEQKIKAVLDSIQQSPDKAGEKLFLLEASMGNLAEIEFSRLAQSKATDPAVKQLAEMLVADHTAAQQKVMSLGSEMGLDLPTALPEGMTGLFTALGSLPDDKFERCYLLTLKANHAKAITSYADHEVMLEDAKAKAYISEALPKLRAHNQAVVKLAQAKSIGTPTQLSLDGSNSSMPNNRDPQQAGEPRRGPAR